MTTPLPGSTDWTKVVIGNSTVTPSAPKKPTDFWSLGNAYGEPVFLGYAPGSNTVGAQLGMGGPVVHPGTAATDITKPTQQMMSEVAKMWSADPAKYAQLQEQLAQAGYYGAKGTFTPGRFDAATESALKTMLQDYVRATRTGTGAPITLDEFMQKNIAATQSALQSQPQPQVSLADPTQIRAAAQAAFLASTDRQATDKELNAFVRQFQSTQQSAQLSTDSRVTAPDLSTEAMAYAQQTHPGEYQAHNAQALQNTLLNMFLPSESARPTGMTTVPAA